MTTRLCNAAGAALVLLLIGLAPLPGEDKPGDLYFEGYQAWQKGESLLKEGKRDEAWPKLKEAEQKIAKVQTQFPDWEREVVAYRLKNIRTRLAELTPPPLTPRRLDPVPPNAHVPPPPAHAIPDEKTPYIPTVKPTPDYLLNRPKVPFIFNGEIYYKMLLSHEKRQSAPQATNSSP